MSSAGVPRPENLADQVYGLIKDDIFEFRLLPGDRFTESEVAVRCGASRTPVRQALYRLQREGFVDVYFRSGWQVRPFDFDRFEALYGVRVILEEAAIRLLSERVKTDSAAGLKELAALWLVPQGEQQTDGRLVAQMDEAFHCRLVMLAGNSELTPLHQDITERIRIVRRLDFTQEHRIAATYREHAAILQAILDQRPDDAIDQLRVHIKQSQTEVRKITLQMLQSARPNGIPEASEQVAP